MNESKGGKELGVGRARRVHKIEISYPVKHAIRQQRMGKMGLKDLR